MANMKNIILFLLLLIFPTASFADYETLSFPELKEKIQNGDAFADLALADRYLLGLEIEEDKEQAVQIIRRVAEKGIPEGQAWLGDLYLEGDILPQNDKKAAYWFEKAAKQGIKQAQERLGMLHLKYNNSLENRIKGFAWLDIVTKQGDPTSDIGRDALKDSFDEETLRKAQKLSDEYYRLYVEPFEDDTLANWKAMVEERERLKKEGIYDPENHDGFCQEYPKHELCTRWVRIQEE